VAIAGIAAVALFPGYAYAYLDPGTGSILLQGLIAAIAGIAVAGRLYWSRIKSALGFGPKKPAPDDPDAKTDHRE
jgi:hypothetical protein